VAFLVEELVGSVEIKFRSKDLPTDPSKLGWYLGNCSQPITEVGLGGFQIGSVGIASGLGQRVVLDRPT